jgi:electron transfer flavoprotein-quinone oxidoreductase
VVVALGTVPTKFDIIVVGAGPAGSSAAYTLAKKGFDVLLVERGRVVGSKNMFGGRVYLKPLKDIYPDFEKSAPIHRWVTKERISLIHNNDITSIEFEGKEATSFITYLSQLANWMAIKAEEEGAILLTEVTVDRFEVEDGRFIGIRVGDETLKSEVIIDAEGANRLLLERSGIVAPLKPKHVALGVKEVIKLAKDEVEKHFGLDENEGLAWILMGDITGGTPGGAFIYTNKDSVSVGLVVILDEAIENIDKHIYNYVEDLRLHPLLKRYFGGGRIMEYSAHLIPEDVWGMMPPQYYYDGLLITGDAAGFLLNLGYTYRGVDFAAYSGYLAAEAVEQAYSSGGPSKENLAVYKKLIEDSFIYRQLRKFRGVHSLMKNKRLFTLYPLIMNLTARNLFLPEDESLKVLEAFKKARKGRVSWFTLLKDLFMVVRQV